MSYSRPSSSTAHSSSTTPQLTPTQLRLYEKQQEYASLLALRQASGQTLEKVEELGKMSAIMADGGAAVGGVMRNWNQVFSILNLFDKPSDPTNPTQTPAPQSKPPTSSNSTTTTTTTTQPHTTQDPEEEEDELPLLVRLQYDKYQAQMGLVDEQQGGQGENGSQ